MASQTEIAPKTKVPPYPLASYRYPRDKLRHWAALQGDRVFASTEILVATELLGAQSALKDLVRSGELLRHGRGKLKVGKLRPIIDEEGARKEAHHEREREEAAWKALEREIDKSRNVHDLVRDSWQDLWSMAHSYWRMRLHEAPWVEKTVFTDVPMRRRPRDEGYEPAYDFWPRSHVEHNRKMLAQYGSGGVEWGQRRGTRQTAEMLGAAQNSEDVAAIWIAAFAHDMDSGRSHIEYSWRGRPYLLVQALGDVVRHYFRGRGHLHEWHHAMTRARPANAQVLVYDGSIVPKSLVDCIGLVALDAILSHALWAPVRIVPTDFPEQQEEDG
jgi:hypothetical protein